METSTLRTALVVESNYLIATVIEAPLASAGYRVFIATNPVQAFAVVETEPLNLALIDFRLQHAAIAKLMSKGIPFVFCTAAAVDEVFEHFPDARVVQKPFTDEQLMAAVAALTPLGPDGDSPDVLS